MKEVKKVILIGLDAPITKSIEKYVKEGVLPNIKKLIEQGTYAENCLVPHPTITPPNWTTIVTGSWPGTHGITCFHIHKPGMKLDDDNGTYQAFDSRDCQAEYIWESAERIGKKSIILNYPTTWPPRIKNGIQIGGAGLHINDWRSTKDGKPLPKWYVLCSASDEQLFSTEEYPFSDRVEFKPVKKWNNLPEGEKFFETEIKVGYRNCREKVEPKNWYLLLYKKDKGWWVRVCRKKDANDIVFEVKNGDWSKKVYEMFNIEGKEKECVFMAKFIEIADDLKKFRLYFTPICQLDGWSYPEEIAKELKDIEGLPFKCMEEGLHLEWYDLDTYIERVELENKWLGECAKYLLKNKEWDMFFMHAHAPDHSYHGFINQIDPSVCKDKEIVKKYESAERRFYISLDKMIGEIVSCGDENTLIIITSDHGAVPTHGYFDEDFKRFSVLEILEKAGLVVFKEENGEKVIDWTKTKAIVQRSVYIYINLKGRDPDGIVEPKDYEKLQDEIIKVLYDYTDPKTGKKPIAFALKKQDARIIGLYGDRIGDIIFGVHGWVSGEHGRQIPTAEYGIGSMKGLLIISGPNIKKNYRLKRTVWLTDIVPTICYLMKMPVPRDTEGAIIYQALEEPNFLLNELSELKKNYERVKKALDSQKALTHQY